MMKQFFALLLLATSCLGSTNCNLLINIGSPTTKVTLTPIQPWRAYNGQLLPAVPISKVTDSSGSVTFSNVASAYDYRITAFVPGGSTLSYTNPIPPDVSGTTNSAGLFGMRIAEDVFYQNGSTAVVSGGGGTNGGTPILPSATIAVTPVSTSNRLDVVGTLTNNTTGNADTSTTASTATGLSGGALTQTTNAAAAVFASTAPNVYPSNNVTFYYSTNAGVVSVGISATGGTIPNNLVTNGGTAAITAPAFIGNGSGVTNGGPKSTSFSFASLSSTNQFVASGFTNSSNLRFAGTYNWSNSLTAYVSKGTNFYIHCTDDSWSFATTNFSFDCLNGIVIYSQSIPPALSPQVVTLTEQDINTGSPIESITFSNTTVLAYATNSIAFPTSGNSLVSQADVFRSPAVTCYTNGSFMDKFNVFHYPTNTVTCGLQEAFDWVYANEGVSGGEVKLEAGVFQTYKTITVNNLLSFKMIGQGQKSSVIALLNPLPMSVFVCAGAGSGGTIVDIEQIGFTRLNSPSIIVQVQKASKSKVEQCCFMPYETFTNSVNFDPEALLWSGGPFNLVALDVTSVGIGTIQGNHFYSCLGISFIGDHMAVLNNEWNGFGIANGTGIRGTNSWPSTSPYRAGAGVTILPQIYNNQNYSIRDNDFVGGSSAYFVVSNGINNAVGDYASYNDSFEAVGGLLTGGAKWTLVSPKGYNTPASSGMANYYLPGPYYTNILSGGIAPTNMVQVYDFRHGSNTWDFTVGRNLAANGNFTVQSNATLSGNLTVAGTSTFTVNQPTFAGSTIQNTSTNGSASTELTILANNGSALSNNVVIGINSGSFTNLTLAPLGTNTAYVGTFGSANNATNNINAGNLSVFSAQTNSHIYISAGNGLNSTNVDIGPTGVTFAGTITGTITNAPSVSTTNLTFSSSGLFTFPTRSSNTAGAIKFGSSTYLETDGSQVLFYNAGSVKNISWLCGGNSKPGLCVGNFNGSGFWFCEQNGVEDYGIVTNGIGLKVTSGDGVTLVNWAASNMVASATITANNGFVSPSNSWTVNYAAVTNAYWNLPGTFINFVNSNGAAQFKIAVTATNTYTITPQ